MTNIQEIIIDIKKRIVSLERIASPSCTTIESHGWIVTYGTSTTAYSFEVAPHPTEAKKFIATRGFVAPCESCTRFTKEDAIKVAASCIGGGESRVARFYRDVCIQELASLQELIAFLEKQDA